MRFAAAGHYNHFVNGGATITQLGERQTPQSKVTGSGAQFEGDLGEILALGAEISPYIGPREKWESP